METGAAESSSPSALDEIQIQDKDGFCFCFRQNFSLKKISNNDGKHDVCICKCFFIYGHDQNFGKGERKQGRWLVVHLFEKNPSLL